MIRIVVILVGVSPTPFFVLADSSGLAAPFLPYEARQTWISWEAPWKAGKVGEAECLPRALIFPLQKL